MTHGVSRGPLPFCIPVGETWAPMYKLLKKSDSFRWTDEM
jgi:hypothetical protein